MKKKILRALLKLLAVAFGVFAGTFAVYFFNLDMKLTAAMEPLLFKSYDAVKRDTHL